ncbi:uncharacterized protein LOC34618045 [Cyclospora cayetanensis]|nr:uncharacterized protein LOC34618045 [Cyclospora cayetanensis]
MHTGSESGSSADVAGLPGDRVLALSPAIQDMMQQVGVMHSACYEEGRANEHAFVICIGRADCANAKAQGKTRLISAPHVLDSPEGKRKVLEVTHAVLSHVARLEQTSNLKVLVEKISALGLACDDFLIAAPH